MKRLITTLTLLAATLCAAAQEATLPTPDAKTLGMGGVAFVADDAFLLFLDGLREVFQYPVLKVVMLGQIALF